MILALFLYFGVIKNSLTLVLAAIIILGINASAYMAEIFRAGIFSDIFRNLSGDFAGGNLLLDFLMDMS